MIAVIANPAAGRGKAARIVEEVESIYRNQPASRLYRTKASGEESELASEALRQGAEIIVVVGGDGTCCKVAEEILKTKSDCRLALIPCGTGNDFAKTLGVDDASAVDIARLVASGRNSRIDVGRVDGHYFINSCGFGFDASVLEATRRVRFLKGDSVYIYSAVRQLFSYRGTTISITSNANSDTRKLLMLTVSNGRFLGGAFQIAPAASVVDGALDVGLFSDTGLLGRARIFAAAFRGTHIELPSVEMKRAPEMTLGFSAPPMMEVDGELRQARSSTVKIECVPRALNVIAAPGFPL
jgi:diacylglycerol kinase (ATP)